MSWIIFKMLVVSIIIKSNYIQNYTFVNWVFSIYKYSLIIDCCQQADEGPRIMHLKFLRTYLNIWYLILLQMKGECLRNVSLIVLLMKSIPCRKDLTGQLERNYSFKYFFSSERVFFGNWNKCILENNHWICHGVPWAWAVFIGVLLTWPVSHFKIHSNLRKYHRLC